MKVARDEVGNFNVDDGIDATAYTALWAALANGSRPQDQDPLFEGPNQILWEEDHEP